MPRNKYALRAWQAKQDAQTERSAIWQNRQSRALLLYTIHLVEAHGHPLEFDIDKVRHWHYEGGGNTYKYPADGDGFVCILCGKPIQAPEL